MAPNPLGSHTACPTCGSVKRAPWKPFAEQTRSIRVSKLLECNEIPSETELSEFQNVVKQGPGRIADIDEKIARARELIDKLVRERISINSEMEDEKILSSPVRRLPLDVLCSICVETIPFPSDIMSLSFNVRNGLDTSNSPWTISQVCRRWRSIFVSAPGLWSSISLVIHTESLVQTTRSEIRSVRSYLHNMFLLGIRLHRSQSFPLTVSLWSASDVSQHHFLILISIHASALKNLRIHVPIKSLGAFSGCRGRLDCLEHLILESNDMMLPEGWANNTFEYAPQLRIFTASMYHFPRAVEIPWFQLSHCNLQIDDEQGLPLLEQLDNVESADIGSIGILLRVHQGHRPIHLPRLMSLVLASQNLIDTTSPDICVIFSSLSLQNLIDLHITYLAVPVLPHISIQPNVITRLELTRLSSTAGIYQKYAFPGLLTLLNTVTNLHCLTLNSARALSSDDISLLGSIQPSAHVPLPHLRVLDLSGCKLECDHSSFIEMVKARRHPDCDQLETLYLASPLKLDDFAAEIWHNLLDNGLNVVYGAQNEAD